MKIIYILVGIAGGILGGMGMGGGTLLIPLLSIVLKVPQHTAQLINLIAFIPMSFVALIIHIKNKLVVWKKLLYIILPAVITAIIASIIAANAETGLLKKLFGGFLVILGVCYLIGMFFQQKKGKNVD